MKLLTLTLKARTAVHVGSGLGNNTTDALIRRDAIGRPIIPGTAIAGALRTTLTRLAPRLTGTACKALMSNDNSCPCAVCQLMGDVNPSDEDEAESLSNASRLLVSNATLNNNSNSTVIRDGVGIDRATRAAARATHAKFNLEALPAHTTFMARLELRSDSQDDERLLAAGLAEWSAGRAWLGGNVARGLGAFSVEVATMDLNVDTADGLIAFLKADDPWQQGERDQEWLSTQIKSIMADKIIPVTDLDQVTPYVARRWIKIEGILQAEGALLTNDTTNAALLGFDHAPLLPQTDDWKNPVLAGSGLRGVLRSHAERIARTIATLQAPENDPESWFKSHCPACNPLANQKMPLTNCDKLLSSDNQLEEVSKQHLCLACWLFGSTRRGSRLLVEDAPYDAEAAGGKPTFKMHDFLAIDRFTGGGADKLKFDALALWKPAFKLNLFLENPESWELGWLALVLRDMQAGWLSVGMGAAKGFGRVRLEGLTTTLGYLDEQDVGELKLAHDGKRTNSIYFEMPVDLMAGNSWVQAFHSEVNEFERSEAEDGKNNLPVMTTDTYFREVNGQAVYQLYPRKVTL